MGMSATMNNVAKLALAASAITTVGITVLWSSSSLSATARAGLSPADARVGLVSDSHGARQTVTEKGVRFSFKVPTNGWERFRVATGKYPRGPISLNKSIVGPQGAEAIIYWTSFPNGDHATWCADLLAPSIGRSAANLAAAVATAPGTKLVKGPADVTLSGYPAKLVVLRVRKNVGCDPGFFYAWPDVFGGALWATTGAGATIRAWIVPVRETRLFIAAITTVQADSRLKREVEQIIESIRFE